MVTKCFRGNQPNRFPSTLARCDFVGEVGAEDKGIVAPISQVIRNSGVPIDVVAVRMNEYMADS